MARIPLATRDEPDPPGLDCVDATQQITGDRERMPAAAVEPGEPATTRIAQFPANTIFSATGRRIRSFPHCKHSFRPV